MISPVPAHDAPVAIVTGASGGIGQAICQELTRNGFNVVATSLNSSLEPAQGQSREALRLRCDVTSRPSIDATLAAVIERFGHVDCLVNNAGINVPAPLREISQADWDAVLAVNLSGPFQFVQAAAEWLMASSRSPSIVNIGSESGLSVTSSPPYNAHYAASKMGLIGLTRVLANSLAPKVRVNIVSPGWIDTPIHDNPAENRRATSVLDEIPLGRVGHPDEVAAMVGFLASPSSGYVTGQNIVVGGGRVFH